MEVPKIYDCGVYRDATEEEIKELEEDAQNAPLPTAEEQGLIFVRAMAATATTLTDAVALAIPDLLPVWDELLATGAEIAAGVCLTHGGQTYRVVQAVTPLESQPPGGIGMEAVYALIDKEHAGTIADPIPAARNMEYTYGKYYRDPEDEKLYLCKRIGEEDGGTIILQYLPHELVGQYFEEVL